MQLGALSLAVAVVAGLLAHSSAAAADGSTAALRRSFAGSPAPPTEAATATVVAEWSTLEYDWPSPEKRQSAINSGEFKPDNNAISGIRFYKNEVYLTTPRWFSGVPSTLNKLVTKDGKPLLQPFPSWDMQMLGNYTALQNVQGIEIDSFGRMWILDVGRYNIMEKDGGVNGPPKLVVWNMETSQLEQTYTFDNINAPYTDSFLQDLVVDEVNGYAYIADASGAYGGAIVVYCLATNSAWRWHDESMAATPGYVFSVDGVAVAGHTAIDGIALSPDSETLYFTPLQSERMYKVNTASLRDATATDAERKQALTYLGKKTGPSGGLVAGSKGTLFFGALANNSVYQWTPADPLSSRSVLVSDATTMQWQDALCFDDSGNLLFTVNRLQLFLQGKMTFDGSINFRVFKVPVGQDSYISAEERMTHADVLQSVHCDTRKLVVGLGVAVGVECLALLACCFTLFAKSRKAKSEREKLGTTAAYLSLGGAPSGAGGARR